MRRRRERRTRNCGASAGPRAVREAPDDVSGPGPLLPVLQLLARKAPGHHQGRRIAGKVSHQVCAGLGRTRGRVLFGRAGRRQGRADNRERRDPGEGGCVLTDDPGGFDGPTVEHVRGSAIRFAI